MKKNFFKAIPSWSSVLTVTVFIYAFLIPVLPVSLEKIPARLGITLIFIAGVLSIDKKKRYILYIALGSLVLQWVSVVFEIWVIVYTSKLLNVTFFLIVVYTLIRQIATAQIVTTKEILESISGYLLIGIVFSIVISGIIQSDSGAYNIISQASGFKETNLNLSASMYYGFITMASVGYGDILPLKPYTRSLATFIAITGQLYIAIIISLMVGKFASGRNKQE